MTEPLDLLSIGRALVDFYPQHDGRLTEVREFRSSVGGSPTNVAIAGSRLGLRTGVITAVGDDPLGQFVVAQLGRESVDTSRIVVDAAVSTLVAVCEIDPPDSFPLTIYRPEPSADLQLLMTVLADGETERARVLWVSLSSLAGEPARTTVLTALANRPRHLETIIDLDHRPAFWPSAGETVRVFGEAIRRATIAIGNLGECRIALGLADDAPAEAAADALLALGVRLAIVKLGERGVLAATADEHVAAKPIQVAVVNGLGAGDAFGGAFCWALMEGMSLTDALRYANAAGALVASRRGASEAMPRRAEIEALLT